jgi:hypothetical protein
VLALWMMAMGVVVAWPRAVVFALVSTPLVLVGLAWETHRTMKVCCGYSYVTVPNPYRGTELALLLVLVVVAWRWRVVRPRPIAALRRLGGYGAGIVSVCTAGSFVEPDDLETTCRAVVAGATVLIACLLVELRLHRPPLPVATAVARADGPPRARIGS